ncbi:hypothetical protein BV25DRAFT_1136606 [Artomyces pyxidatus]|uniref:Uncharacterized protein n=1 Tax=Artomyces pyxidatus TaxID=48021 RepID=A0ACB8SS00_9AGAM|nr:hypothetical protein BV25DRAFT_1136606 [Artomyces pyxidatus]
MRPNHTSIFKMPMRSIRVRNAEPTAVLRPSSTTSALKPVFQDLAEWRYSTGRSLSPNPPYSSTLLQPSPPEAEARRRGMKGDQMFIERGMDGPGKRGGEAATLAMLMQHGARDVASLRPQHVKFLLSSSSFVSPLVSLPANELTKQERPRDFLESTLSEKLDQHNILVRIAGIRCRCITQHPSHSSLPPAGSTRRRRRQSFGDTVNRRRRDYVCPSWHSCDQHTRARSLPHWSTQQ